ncbi:hypothetical protein JSY36_06790 [Bacillus sp. H-16]|uniref:hypothetical protein n=1 Tax=Alteribacter salitolerans TaxID=2912333 RepID=UPI0019640802|nr:hypothetical protein [Alteribacter salitolerans]MBM7095452.1 hypothetical protein [Alteribacter salitolerans]
MMKITWPPAEILNRKKTYEYDKVRGVTGTRSICVHDFFAGMKCFGLTVKTVKISVKKQGRSVKKFLLSVEYLLISVKNRNLSVKKADLKS